MKFGAATDRIIECCRLHDVATALGCSYSLVRQARLSRTNVSFRNPPRGWQKALAKLARKRARELERLAEQLGG